MGDDRSIADAAEDLAALQKAMLVRLHRMRLEFDGELAREGRDPLQPAARVRAAQREEEVARDGAAGPATRSTACRYHRFHTLFSPAWKQKFLRTSVPGGSRRLNGARSRTSAHDDGRRCARAPSRRAGGIRRAGPRPTYSKARRQTRVERRRREAVTPQVAGHCCCRSTRPRGHPGSENVRGEVQMKAGVDPALPGERRRARRILHEDHGAHRGDGARRDAFENPGRGLGVASPVVRVDDEKAGDGQLVKFEQQGRLRHAVSRSRLTREYAVSGSRSERGCRDRRRRGWRTERGGVNDLA